MVTEINLTETSCLSSKKAEKPMQLRLLHHKTLIQQSAGSEGRRILLRAAVERRPTLPQARHPEGRDRLLLFFLCSLLNIIVGNYLI